MLTTLLFCLMASAESLPFGKGKLTVTALTPTAFRIQALLKYSHQKIYLRHFHQI